MVLRHTLVICSMFLLSACVGGGSGGPSTHGSYSFTANFTGTTVSGLELSVNAGSAAPVAPHDMVGL